MIQYVSQPKKTMDEKGHRYLTGVNCVADVAMQSFMATKHLYGKDTGTFFYQYTQSFSQKNILLPPRPMRSVWNWRSDSSPAVRSWWQLMWTGSTFTPIW